MYRVFSEEDKVMSIIYKCRHCKNIVGQLEQQSIDASLLGLEHLNKDDKRNMIHYQNNGDIHIQTICESCEDTLGHHPEYHELDFFIQ